MAVVALIVPLIATLWWANPCGAGLGIPVIAGSATMWLGPLLVQIATALSGSQRVGLLLISGLLLIGLAVLQRVPGGYRATA